MGTPAMAKPDALSPRDARAQAQRNRILDAAQKCFAERGFHGAGMALIADTAQMSPGLIYRYFAGKSELIHGIVSRNGGVSVALVGVGARSDSADSRCEALWPCSTARRRSLRRASQS